METPIEEPEYYVNPYYNLNSILATPCMTVPALTDEDIEVSLLQAMFAYVKGDLPLHTLIDIATTIQLFMGMRENRHTLSDHTEKIKTLTPYIPDTLAAKEIIDNTLIEIFERIIAEKRS